MSVLFWPLAANTGRPTDWTRMTDYRPNGTPAGFTCQHESARGRDNAEWVCDACGYAWPKTDAEKAFALPSWAYAAENLPAAREAGYDV